MIHLSAVIVANSAGILLLLIVMLSRKKNIHYGLFDEKLFGFMLVLNILLCTSEMITFLVDGNTAPFQRVLSIFCNSLNFVLNMVFTLTWTLYIDYKLFENRSRIRRLFPVLVIPVVCVIIGVFVNLFTPIFFSVQADNVYRREALHVVPFAISYAYLIHGIILVYSQRKNARRYLFLPVVIFLAPVFIASVTQYLYYGISLLWLGTAIGIVSLYINVQNQTTYIDSLSGIFNRQYLIGYLEKWVERGSSDERLVGYMLDIDEFKAINDRYGHVTGDRVIADVGALLCRAADRGGFAARYGGDEFVVIQRCAKENSLPDQARAMIASIQSVPPTPDRPYAIHLSVGVRVFQSGDTADSFIAHMDAAMYIEKNKRMRCARGGEQPKEYPHDIPNRQLNAQ